MPAMSFAAATAVSPTRDGRYAGVIEPGWDIAGNANGGYLLAIAARAMLATADRPDPVSVTAHYLAPGKPGAVELATELLRRGRRFATVRALMSTDDQPLMAVLGSFAELTPVEASERVEGGPPDLPPVEDCIAVEPTDTFPPPFMGKVELRLHPDDFAFDGGVPTGRLRVRGWFRFRGGEPLDTVGLLVAVDAFPPVTFAAGLPIAWTPTLELTAHVRARPGGDWLRCAFTTRFITGGFLEEDGEVWDDTGRLVAQSRQLALLPRGS